MRLATDVLQQLLTTLDRTVTAYHPTVARTGRTVAELIDGTAFFPGGSGLWRGHAHGGPLPELFPPHPVMFVGHNFDSHRAYERSLARRGEAHVPFWRFLLTTLDAADLRPVDCFFTNALMGVKPGSATGPMPRVPGYLDQCRAFLAQQTAVVQPRCIVALGNNAACFVRELPLPSITLKHPSSWIYTKGPLRPVGIHEEGRKLAALLSTLPETT